MLKKCPSFVNQVLACFHIVAFLLLALPVFAQVTEIEPDSAVLDETETNVSNDSLLVAQESPARTLAQIETQLQSLEGSMDAYDIGIGELSLELGAHYAELGYYEQSLEAYRRALHITRINFGLTSERQLPILESFLDLYEKSGHFDEARFVFEKMLLIYNENYDPWSPALADLYQRIGSWHLAIYYHEMDQQPVSHLVAANIALSNAHFIDNSQRDPAYDFNIYNLLTLANWGLSTYYIHPDSARDFSARDVSYSRTANAYINNADRGGRNLLEKGIDAATKTGDPENIIKAKLLYADWNQLFNRPQTARQYYLEAYNHAQQLPLDNPLRQSFSLPHPLPDFDAVALSVQPQSTNNLEITVTFNVTEWGRTQNISVMDRPLEDETGVDEETNAEDQTSDQDKRWLEASSKAARTIRNTIFRPAFVGGQPSDFENVRQVIPVAEKET